MTTDFRERLAALAEAADAPPSTVDIARAVQDGRRRRLRTRLAAAGAGGLAAAAAVVVFAAGTNPGGNGFFAADARAGHGGPDPLVAHVNFGWLPDGYAQRWQSPYSVTALTAVGGDTAPFYVLDVSRSEPKEPFVGRNGLARIPATVAGSPEAYWFSADPHRLTAAGTVFLTWRIDDGWARLSMTNPGAPTGWQLTMPRIAAGARLVEQPVAMPFHIQGLPTAFTAVNAALGQTPPLGGPGDHAWKASVDFAVDGSQVQVYAQPDPGHAYFPSDSCTWGRGLLVCVNVEDSDPRSLAAIGGTQGLLGRVTPLGIDPVGWTTDVLVPGP